MKPFVLAMLASLTLAGCASSAPPDVLPFFNPAEPTFGGTGVHYHPVVSRYEHREPVEPRPWRRRPEPGAGS